jgi:DNA repair exonuclease SbcCD ATPase subunit
MRLTRLQASGIKNQDGTDIQVPPLLGLIGPTGAGKTALIQALKIGALGYDPDTGKTLAATRQLSPDGEEIEVGLTFDDFGILRKVGRSMKTEVSPDEGERTEAERQARIDRELGGFVLSWDVGSYLDLSPDRRRAALFSMLPRDLANLDRDKFCLALGYGEAKAGLRAAIDALWIEHVLASESPVDGLAGAIEFARKQANGAELARVTQARVLEKVSAAIDEMEADVVAADPDQLGDWQAEVADVERRLGELAGVLEERREQAAEAERQRYRIQARRTELEARSRSLAQKEVELTQKFEVLKRVLEEQEEAEAPTLDDLTEFRERVAHLMERQLATTKQLELVTDQLRGAQAALTQTTLSLRHLGEGDSCPTCGSVGDFAAAVDRLEDELRERTHTADRLRKEMDNASAAAIAATTSASSAERKLAVAEAEQEAALQQWETRDARIQETRTRIEETRTRIEEVQSDLVHTVESLNAVHTELAEARDERPPAPSIEVDVGFERSRDKLRGRRDELNRKITLAQSYLRRQGEIDAERSRYNRESDELDKLTRRAAALDGLYKRLQELRKDVIRSMLFPIERAAERLLRGIDQGKDFRFVWEVEGKDACDFGFEENGRFRSFSAASGGERLFLVVVFVAAILAAVQPAWRVLVLDNIEALDDVRRLQLLRTIEHYADLFDNVIVAGCCRMDGYQGAFQFHEVAEWPEPVELAAAVDGGSW